MAQGTGTPKVTVAVQKGNLMRQIIVLGGIAGIVGTATQVGNIGQVRKVNGLDDAEAKGYTPELEPFLHSQIKEFYDELGGNMEFWVLGVEDTMTMKSMCTATNANGVKKLVQGSGKRVNLVGVCRQPADTYDPGEGFLDDDVADAVLLSKTLCQALQSQNYPIRIIVEGRVNDQDAPPAAVNTLSNTYAGVVVGNNTPDGSGAVGLVLGRACKYGEHDKIGNGLNGALSITDAYIGDKPIDDFFPEELDVFADAGFIILTRRDGQGGFYFGRDNMAGDDDFRILVHGRVVDKAHKIAVATSTPYLESNVRITDAGLINDKDAAFLEEQIKAQIIAKMGDQISNVDCTIPLDQNLIETSTLAIEISILPLGYLTWIKILIGLTKTL